MTSIAATFRGAAIAIPTEFGFQRSCCSRPAWLPCWITMLASCSAFRRWRSWRRRARASVLAAWSGLGYYHRARRMHQAAKMIARERRGVFPTLGGGVAGATGHWPIYRSRDRQHRFRRSRLRWWTAMWSAFCCGCSARLRRKEAAWQQGGGVARSRTSRRFQPGDDGVGRDRLHAASAAMPDLSGAFVLRDPRRGSGETAGSQEESGHALCPHTSRRFRVAGTARGGRVVDGGDVGVAADSLSGDT